MVTTAFAGQDPAYSLPKYFTTKAQGKNNLILCVLGVFVVKVNKICKFIVLIGLVIKMAI